MAKDFLGEFGSDSMPDSRASGGGQMAQKPIPYSPPTGAVIPMSQKPGIGGTNHGCCGTQGKH
jgi:hypothetical protein